MEIKKIFKQKFNFQKKPSFSLVEILLSIAVFAILSLVIVSSISFGIQSNYIAGAKYKAVFLADEGLEGVRNIRDQSFSNLVDGTYGLNTASNKWAFNPTSDTTDNCIRKIKISTVDTVTKQVNVVVNCPQSIGQANITENIVDIYKTLITTKGGVLVYGDGSNTSDIIKYKVLDPSTGTWSAPLLTADVDTLTTNKVLRAAQIYASNTRNEKVLISRHFDGIKQYIYSQVYNGTNNTWGNVNLLSSFTSSSFLDVQNFSGTYLNNGDFMATYSDNTSIPKYSVWNGSSWGIQNSMQGIKDIPVYIVSKARPNSNEVMVATFDQSLNAYTNYFNGSSYSLTSNWTAIKHGKKAPTNTVRLIDFTWSDNTPTVGALVYANYPNETSINIDIWTADGAGSGSWSGGNASNSQNNLLGSLTVVGHKGANEFVVCDKDEASSTSQILCYKSDFSGNWSTITNNTITNSTDTGIQKSFDQNFEYTLGSIGINVYSDNTSIPKLKKYTVSSSTFDSVPVSINALSSVTKTIRTIQDVKGNDIMILMTDNNKSLYSVIWNGTSNTLYSSPIGKAFTTHGTQGSVNTDYWYDFAWDKF